MAVILELKNVSFVAQNRIVVKNFSHQFEEGKTTALVGPSGSGKSTILKLTAGLLVPSEGEVSFRGQNITHMNRQDNLDFRREGSMVFQDSALWANQNLYQILELPLRIHFPRMPQSERENRIQSVLRDVGYKRDLSIRPSLLSMGEQKLIAFARAMLCRPKLLFLDEWTESLDDSAAQRLISLVHAQQNEHHTVLLVSHDFRIIKNMADYVLMILGGQFFLKLSREQMEEDEDLSRYVERGIAS
ncbi:ABC transporter ATP-binding protein [Leadbettera azotonutricia]|uniref:Putative ABC transporter, ATP-binding protein n=1 Tax=Leadbettera azotonutricia (strain ATCC BAA-888 / DSM 13862 / ZAS-9) TaxID=545695 RepID=F5Y8F5_LEAAZ|nr:ABC transporter ATP-binding protein [Leadbettera azotonutricia]AEF81519.1 putative ABC transporter, ATP-binding protein [Leadbettera azotonutricia ZAS-9]